MSSLSADRLFNVNGQVVVITGGGTGIGEMMAKALATNGAARVYVLGRRLDRLQGVAKLGVNNNIVPLQCDVTSRESLVAAASHIKQETGFVNIVIANSGITGPTLSGLPENPSIEAFQSFLWNQADKDYADTYELNVIAVQNTLLAFMLLLDEGNRRQPSSDTGIKSQFIATSSIAAFNRKATGGFAYGGSKAAVTLLMKQMSGYLAPYHIRVNVICPGLYPSEIYYALHPGKEGVTAEGSIPGDQIPATRTGSEEDMGGTILYLCSRAGAYCNGNVVISDGGRLSIMPGTY